jgi:hypothetical protein
MNPGADEKARQCWKISEKVYETFFFKHSGPVNTLSSVCRYSFFRDHTIYGVETEAIGCHRGQGRNHPNGLAYLVKLTGIGRWCPTVPYYTWYFVQGIS